MEYRSGFYEDRRSLLLKQPDAINTISDCKHWGAYASRYIAEARETIRQMQEYQAQLYARVQLLSIAPWHYELKLTRRRSYTENRVYYDLTLTKVFEDATIKPEEVQRTTYPGAERYAAFAAYEAERKAHPGIIAVKDIAKSAWER